MAIKLLSPSDVKQSITMVEAIEAMERAFMQLAQNEVVLPLRTGVPVQERGLTLTMPGYLTQEQALGLKVISVFPDNVKLDKTAISGIILLLDAATGEPLTMMDAGYLTALRTGAVSGLATKYFSQEKACNIAIIGSGVQAFTQLEAVAAVREIKKVFVWSRHFENAKQFAQKMNACYDIEACKQLSAAVKEADVICTATSSTEPLIHFPEIQSHTHINAIGSHTPMMREISEDVLMNSVVIVDQLEAAMSESGEIINAIAQEKLKKESIIEIGSWLLKKSPDLKKELTVFKSVGLAIQDLSVAHVVYQNAMKMNLGTSFELG